MFRIVKQGTTEKLIIACTTSRFSSGAKYTASSITATFFKVNAEGTVLEIDTTIGTNGVVALSADTGSKTGFHTALLNVSALTAKIYAVVFEATIDSVPSIGPPEFLDISAERKKVADFLDASIANEAANLFHLVESQRGTHTGRGKMIHWMPVGGSDGNNGLSRAQSLLTWAAVEALITAYNHDIVFIHPVGGGQPTVVDLTFVMSQAFTLLRGPGRDIKFKPTTSTNDTVTIAAPGCEIAGFIAETHTSGNRDAIKVLADFYKIESIWADYSRGHALAIENASHGDINRLIIQDAAAGGSGHAISVKSTSGNAKRNFFRNIRLLHNAGDGFRLDGVNTQDNFIFAGDRGSSIDLNTGWGVNEINGASHNHIIGPNLTVHANTAGDINLSGANSLALNIDQFAKEDSGGTGANQVVVQTEIAGGSTPIVGVFIQIFNAGQTLLLAKGITDISGQTTLALDNGTYKVRLYKAGYTFTVPETIVVNGNGTFILDGTVVDIGIPLSINTCRVYEWCYMADDSTPKASITAKANIVNLPYSYNTKLHAGDVVTGTYDPVSGKVYWDIVYGATVQFKIPEMGLEMIKTVPSVSSKRLSEIV